MNWNQDTYIKTCNLTEREIQLVAYQSIQKQLGAVGLFRFIQQFERGRGDYTKGRYERLGDLRVDGKTGRSHNQFVRTSVPLEH